MLYNSRQKMEDFMPIQPVTPNFSAQPTPATSAGTFTARPGDTLSQAASSSTSSDGFIMSMLKPVGRFFTNLVSYFKYLICCCADKAAQQVELPKLSVAQLGEWFGEGFKVEKMSDYVFKITEVGHKDKICTFEVVLHEEGVAIAADAKGKFKGSSMLIFQRNPESEKEVFKGPIPNVLSFRQDNNYTILVFIRDGKVIPIHFNDESQNYKWTMTGFEDHLELLPEIVRWVEETRFHQPDQANILKATTEADSPTAEALVAAGLTVKGNGKFKLELPATE